MHVPVRFQLRVGMVMDDQGGSHVLRGYIGS